MRIQIITDSTCDMSLETQKELNIKVVPLSVIFEDGTYRDGIDIDKREFYQKQATVKVLPKTSQVNPDEFLQVFQECLDQGDQVLGIFLSSKLSGTFQSAVIAKEMLGSDQIHLVDAMETTVALGLLVREAVKMSKNGAAPEEIATHLDEIKHRVQFLAVVNTLKYLKMGGRISASTAIIGGVLGISPVVSIENGLLEAVGKVKGKQKALEYVLEHIQKNPIDKDYPVAFAHTDCPDVLESFMKDCCSRAEITDCFYDEIGAVIGTHAGPGCYGIAYVKQR